MLRTLRAAPVRRPATAPEAPRPGGVATALLVAALATPAAAQLAPLPVAPPPKSPPAQLFVPTDASGADLVPLSEFGHGAQGEVVTLHVRASILDALGGGLLVAERDGADVALHPPVAVASGASPAQAAPFALVRHVVRARTADVVVVHRDLVNRFDHAPGAPDVGMVTHFRDGGDGAWTPGWTDGVERWTVDDTGIVLVPNGTGFEPPPGSPYFWNSEGFPLFIDSTGSHGEALVPGWERYIGEDWSPRAVDKLYAMWWSDVFRATSGIPTAFRNVVDTTTPLELQTGLVDEGLPVFQLLHNHVVRYDDGINPGSENSLASFFFPPGWVADPDEPYPVVFNSGYDTGSSVFRPSGAGGQVVNAVADAWLGDPDRKALGIWSNGGGHRATVTLQDSAIHNLNRLFDDASAAFGASRSRIVSTGFSRSATAELRLWSHPLLAPDLSAEAILAVTPVNFPGDDLANHVNGTFRLLQLGVQEATGWADAWMPGWTAPDWPHPDGMELASQVLLGTTDPTTYDQANASGAPSAVARLAERGTTVVLQTGTHDISRPFSHVLRYVAALQAHEVPYRFDVLYRLGHGSSRPYPTESDLLRLVFDGASLSGDDLGTHYHHPGVPPDELKPLVTHEFDPPRAPVFLEAPLRAAQGATTTWSVVGPPGTLFFLLVDALDPTGWQLQRPIIAPLADGLPPLSLLGGTLHALPPAPDPALEMTARTFRVPTPAAAAGPWEVLLYYSVDGLSVGVLTAETSAPASVDGSSLLWDTWPVFEVVEDETLGVAVEGRTGGASEDLALHPHAWP